MEAGLLVYARLSAGEWLLVCVLPHVVTGRTACCGGALLRSPASGYWLVAVSCELVNFVSFCFFSFIVVRTMYIRRINKGYNLRFILKMID